MFLFLARAKPKDGLSAGTCLGEKGPFADDADVQVHLAIFGQSFIVLAFVAPSPELSLVESGALECEPGCLKIGYPYGLPRLSDDKLKERFARR
jgi:hypothetical protein